MAHPPAESFVEHDDQMLSLAMAENESALDHDDPVLEALALIRRVNARIEASTLTPRGVPQVA